MKIGILTFHYVHNYGALLQAYAMQEYLRKQNHDVEIIDFKQKHIEDAYSWYNLNKLKRRNIIMAIVEFFKFSKRYRRYKSVQHFIDTQLNVMPVGNLSRFDKILVGSDQIWNSNITGGYDNLYWGSKDTNYISYAASIGKSSLNASELQVVKDKLTNFQHIAVRESSALFLQKLTNTPIDITIDPTMLIASDFWIKHAHGDRIVKEHYILYYQVKTVPGLISQLEKFAKNKKLKLIILSAYSYYMYSSPECISISPLDFLKLFAQADFVTSSSFHGTVFSLIFHKPFCTIMRGFERDERIGNLVDSVGLSRYAIQQGEEIIDKQIDWESVDLKIDDLRIQSQEILSAYLKD